MSRLYQPVISGKHLAPMRLGVPPQSTNLANQVSDVGQRVQNYETLPREARTDDLIIEYGNAKTTGQSTSKTKSKTNAFDNFMRSPYEPFTGSLALDYAVIIGGAAVLMYFYDRYEKYGWKNIFRF